MRLPAQNIRLSQHRRSWQYNIISHCDFRALVWIPHLCIASTGQKSSLSWWKIWLWRNAPPATLVIPTDCLCLLPWHGKHWSTVDHQLPECVNFTFWQSKHSHTLPSIYQNYFDIWNWIRNDVAPISWILSLDIQVRFTNFECNGLDDKSRYGISSQHSNADLIHIGTTKDFNYKSNVTMQNYCVNSLLRRPMCNND